MKTAGVYELLGQPSYFQISCRNLVISPDIVYILRLRNHCGKYFTNASRDMFITNIFQFLGILEQNFTIPPPQKKNHNSKYAINRPVS